MSTSAQSTAEPETTADSKTTADPKTLLLEDQKPTEYREVDKNKIDTIDNLKAFLKTKNISIENWGKDDAKSVNDLLKEIKENETILLEKGNKLVRVISAVWVKMLYKVEKDILPESLKNKEPFVGNYYLIETCTTTKKLEITPKVTTKVTTTVAKVDGRYETDMMLPNYKGKPLAGKQTAGEQGDTSNRESIRESALNTATREICEELNIILTSEDFTPFMMVEWYPKKPKNPKNLVGGGASEAQKQSIREFIKKNPESKTYTDWEKTRTNPPTKNKQELKEYFAEKLKMKNAILKTQKEAKRKKEAKEKAVTKIQALQRGKKARVKAKKEKEKKKKIQSCESCSENSIKHTEEEGGKLVTWEWIKDAKNDEDSGTTLNDMPPIENARASKSYPTLPTLYQIIHLRTINLATKGWGTQWKDKKLDMETLNKVANDRTKLMEVYPPPYCTWQEKPSPFCFNVYENPANKGKCNNKKILQQKNRDERQAARKKQEAEEAEKPKIEDVDGGGKRKKRRTRKRKKKGTRKRKKKRTRKRKRKKRSKN